MTDPLPQPEPFLSEEAIASRVTGMGREIAAQNWSGPLHVIAVSNGALLFVADLIRAMDMPLHLDTVSAHSYVGMNSSGTLSIRSELKLDIKGKPVLLVDDILDTGRTLSKIHDHLLALAPSDLKTCVLLDKRCCRQVAFEADYVGFEIPDRFVVGYGLDYNEFFRNLPYIGVIEDSPSD